ncbi:MAG: ATP-binding protein, partial [Ignavibacteria bacterium]|nr:ATP-binding protein [Ignavibacteria bacterium]
AASLNLIFEDHFDSAVIIHADEYSVTHAISNLIDNAIKYTKRGFIKIVLCSGLNDDVLVKVKDSGIGMKEEYLEHLFEPYRQEDMGYGRAYEGVGLGLSLVKQFLALNDAQIIVESKRDFGTTFTVSFTKSRNNGKEAPAILKITRKVEPREQSVKSLVLVVEDDLINQVTIRNFLANNYRAIVIASSDDAVDVLEKNNFDFIQMEISIRGSKNGLELTNELKSRIEFKHIPIIAITAHAFDKDRQNALAAGCDEYLSKPFTKVELLNMLATFSGSN